MVLWIIGMSASGKTAVGREVYQMIKKDFPHTVFLDGDTFRTMMGNDLGYTLEDRKKNADRICQFCSFLNKQGIHVVCSILSVFHESQQWNREHLKNYYEVYLKVPLEVLEKRDPKGIYQAARKETSSPVVGVDLEFPEPFAPDLIIENDGRQSVGEVAEEIFLQIKTKLDEVSYVV